MTNDLLPPLLTTEALGSFLGLPSRTLEDWRLSDDCGPAWVRMGRLVRYRPDDVENWMEDQRGNGRGEQPDYDLAEPPRLTRPWTVEDLARYLTVKPRTVRRWVSLGRGPVALRLGQTTRFLPQDIRRWLDELGM